jgi:endonuclease V-like protein UPF0215 family
MGIWMKQQVRILAFDDGPFKFSDETVPLVGALVRLPNYVEAVMADTITVDGSDADDAIARLVARSRYREQVRLVMLDGAAMGGFNVVDIDRLRVETGLPFATVTRDKPDMKGVRAALRKHFPDWRARHEVLSRREPRKLDTGHNPIYVDCAGIGFEDASELVRRSIVRGAIPEPLRIAHLIATAMAKGESRGRA